MNDIKFFRELWKKGINKKDFVAKCLKYWEGADETPGIKGAANKKAESENICRQIVETKTALALDNMITLEVVPEPGTFTSLQTLKEQREVADVQNDALKDVLRKNKFNKFKEKIMRWGEICGFAPCEVIFDKNRSAQGEIVLNAIDPRNVRWDSAAKELGDVTYFGVEITISAQAAKKMYGIDRNGGEKKAIIDLIDEHAKTETPRDNEDKDITGIVGYSDGNQLQGQAYVSREKNATKSSIKTIKLVRLYLKDDTLYLPDKDDDSDTEKDKQEWKRKYPFGRVVVFIEDDESEKELLQDEALPRSFGDNFGLAIFNPLSLDKIEGHGEIKPLMFIQQRINAAYVRLWWCIAAFVSCIVLPKTAMQNDESDFVNKAVVKLDAPSGITLQVVTNNTLDEIDMLLNVINTYEQKALRIARINEQILSGETSTNITSGEQVAKLNESPMTSIRQIQRNFSEFLTDIGNKILTQIVDNYDTQRLIKLSTKKADGSQYALFGVRRDDAANVQLDENGTPVKILNFYNEQGQLTKSIALNADWKFRVEVTTGGEIHRSRTENSQLMLSLYQTGFLGDTQDPDVKELLAENIDLPNRRAVLEFIRAKAAQKPPTNPIKDNPEFARTITDAVNKLSKAGHNEAANALLRLHGLPDKTDTILTAPIQELSNRGDLLEVQQMRNIARENIGAEVAAGQQQINNFVNNPQKQPI